MVLPLSGIPLEGHLLFLSYSTLGRIIRLTQEVIDYREWIIKKWGGKDSVQTDNRGTNHLRFCPSFCQKSCMDAAVNRNPHYADVWVNHWNVLGANGWFFIP